MLDPKLIDWIKSEEAKKIPDKKLRVRLIKEGWPEKDVDKAVNLAHKGKVNWMPLIITFSLVLIFELIFNSFLPFIFAFMVLIFSLFYGLIPYYKSEKSENYFELFIIIFTSGMFSLFVSLLFFNLIVLLVHWTKISVSIPLMIVIPALVVIFLFLIFYYSLYLLSKHFLGYFNAESYFVFKHWPFKVLNVNWKNKWTLLKYPFILILITLVVLGFIFNLEVERQQRNSVQSGEAVKLQLEFELTEACLEKFMLTKNETDFNLRNVPVTNNFEEYLYDSYQFRDISKIYYDCDFYEFTCKEKAFNQNIPLELQIQIDEGVNVFHILDFPDKELLYYAEPKDFEEIIPCIALSEEMLELSVFQEIKVDQMDAFGMFFNFEDNEEWTMFNYPAKVTETVIHFVELGLKLGKYRPKITPAEFEFNAIKTFEMEGNFYDKTESLIEHKNKLQNNVNELNKMYKNKNNLFGFDNEGSIGGWSDMLGGSDGVYHYSFLLSYEGSYTYLIDQSNIISELEGGLVDVRSKYEDLFVEMFMDLDNEVSEEGKIIRLKIIENMLAERLFNQCRNYNEGVVTCWKKILELTQSPELFTDERHLAEIRKEVENVS